MGLFSFSNVLRLGWLCYRSYGIRVHDAMPVSQSERYSTVSVAIDRMERGG